jgi:hypothetical protein
MLPLGAPMRKRATGRWRQSVINAPRGRIHKSAGTLMKFGHRFFIYAPFALFVILAVGAGGRWWIIANELSARLDRLNGHEFAPGMTLHFGSKRISGFPFNLDTVFHDFEIDVATPRGPFRWRTRDFATHALTYGRSQTIIETTGLQTFDWTGLNGKPRAYEFIPGSLRGDTIDDGSGLTRIDIVAVGVGSAPFTAADVQLHMRVSPAGNGLDVFFAANGIRLSPRQRFAFGNEIRTIRLEGKLEPLHPFDGLRARRADWVSAVEDFRKAGGVLAVQGTQIQFPTFNALGKGRLALDEAHRPSGILDFKITGFARFIEWSQSRVADRQSGMAVASALLDRATKAGSNPSGEMGVVIGAKDGIAYVGDEPAGMLSPSY